MKIVEKGDPDKIKAIKEERELANTPRFSCACDAVLCITKDDIHNEMTDGKDKFYIICPECGTTIPVGSDRLPRNYRKPVVLVGLPWHDVPGANCPVPTPPISVPGKLLPKQQEVYIGDPPPDHYPYTTCSDGVIPLSVGNAGVIPLTFDSAKRDNSAVSIKDDSAVSIMLSIL